jgi:predicted transcriptional regulator
METLKKDAIDAITKLPESATIDDIMYRLYVIDKIRKGKDAVRRGETVTIDELKKEIRSW